MNRFNDTLVIMSAAALTAFATGCSVVKQQANRISGSSATEITTPAQAVPSQKVAEPEPIVPETVEDTTTNDTTEISCSDEALAALQTMNTELARSLGGEWTIFQVGTTTIDRDEDMPYIIFEPSTGRFYANNGCNTLNGFYSVADDKLQFANVMSTLRLCPDVPYESAINQAISELNPVGFTISEGGSESFLDVLGNDGKSIMRMRRGNLQFLNGYWEVKSITGLHKLEAPANVFFDLSELRLNGDTGCNIVNGNIYLDHRRPNAVDFSNMMTTRMACPFDKQQTAMLVALEQTASALSDGKDKVMLLDDAGKVLMTLVKAEAPAE